MGPDIREDVIELRQYTLKPGRRDELIELFERELIEGQQAAGMRILGQFHDADDADRFVWLRGFTGMAGRRQALADFYGGPVWQTHRSAANDSMLDSDNVLLLRPAYPGSNFNPSSTPDEDTGGSMFATLQYFDAPVSDEVLAFFAQVLVAAWARIGVPVLASFSTEYGANDFPALPVREGEHVLLWFSRHADAAAYQRHQAQLAEWPRVSAAWARLAPRPAQVLELRATPRSWLRG
ncbi:MAG: NIPSNAP family protein [Pseudoxanthomonas sp.]